MFEHRYATAGDIQVTRREAALPVDTALESLLTAIDRRRGVILTSAYEYPGRYKRWSMGFVDPPIEIACRGLRVTVTALNDRGRVLLPSLRRALAACPDLSAEGGERDQLVFVVQTSRKSFTEEERSRQPSVFSALRAIIALFASDADTHLGLYGAFGYDLIYQFDAIENLRPRPEDQRDLVLYLPDRLIIVDYHASQAHRLSYDFETASGGTEGLPRDGTDVDYHGKRLRPAQPYDMPPGAYGALVTEAIEQFRCGNLFEVVLGQTFYRSYQASPSALFATLRRVNPSPYGFLANLGGEYLIGASPEMYVRVEGRRVETCPICGTIPRGKDAIEDAEQIRALINSYKDEAELTMCTDVDRNDKSRICEPGTVHVIGRRQIELYSHLIHTVDHVEGQLRAGCDALDAFLSHCWAVTVTGAPKRAAVEWIESREVSPRRWYGGAVGRLAFNGDLNTGLTLRTIRLQDEIAEVRAGATLLYDSIPEAEEQETHVKAAALLKALAETEVAPAIARPAPRRASGTGPRVLMVDCEDSFVLTLADYLRQTGADITTLRHTLAAGRVDEPGWDLLVLSPGPGRPERFGVPALVRRAAARRLPVFGVCLGLQGIVEAFGGTLGTLPEPWHGKASPITLVEPVGRLFRGLPKRFAVGRYHSLYGDPAHMPAELLVTAKTDDGVPMAVEHRTLPIFGVQFHPESILTLGQSVGPTLIANLIEGLVEGTLKRSG